MKKQVSKIIILFIIFNCVYSVNSFSTAPPTQIALDKNNIASWIWSNGVFNQRNNNPQPGFEWPKGTGRHTVMTSGICLAAYMNNQFRLATSLYGSGEYSPGYCVNGGFNTNSTFKLYRVTRGDNQNNNPDWANWGLMVPYGAPFKDVNNNGTYEPAIDTPGVKGAAQTVFLCMTDADASLHNMTFPFYGSTAPLGAEIHLTAWCYDSPGLGNSQFLKWAVINKNTSSWDSTLFTLLVETDLGGPDDDAMGCDTLNNYGFCYNLDNDDQIYGPNPPAYGMRFLNCSGSNAQLKTFTYFSPCLCPPPCEMYPDNSAGSYNFMKGIKKDATPFVIPNTNPPQITKFLYSGDMESGNGWKYGDGKIYNCGGSLTGQHVLPGPISDVRFIMTTSPPSGRINPNDTFVVQAAQFIARGNNYFNTFTQLKREADVVYQLCQNGFVIGINPISTEIPIKFNLYQNYPNPFNPVTKIKFDLPKSENVIIKIYDALGREIVTLVNEKLKAGIYSVDWDGINYPSGVYFYNLSTESYSETRKMVLVK